MLDPEAIAILSRIATSSATTAELAEGLGLEAAAVRRHLRRLVESGQATKSGTARPRTRTETVYAADLRAGVLDPGELAGLPRRLLDEADLAILRVMYREATAAAAGGILRNRPESALARMVIPVDDGAMRQVSEAHRRLLEHSVVEVGRARERLARGKEAPIVASVQIVFVEYPAERWPPRASPNGSRRGASLDRVEKILEFAKPFPASILAVLSAFPATAGDLAGRLDAPVSKVRYELDRLLAAGAVRVDRTRRSRGTLDRVFVMDINGRMLTTEEIAGSRLRTEPGSNARFLRSLFGEALETIRTGTSRDQVEPVIARIPTALDAEGFLAISTLIEGTLRDLADLHESALQARVESSSPARFALSGLLLFEHPPGGASPRTPSEER